MKKYWVGLMMVAALSGGSVFAASKDVTVAVKGMVCGFCAQGIEKKFSAQPAVEKVKVSLSDKQVKLTLKDGQDISDELIKQILADAGYNVEKVERN
jgi:mercuric ion binding protein